MNGLSQTQNPDNLQIVDSTSYIYSNAGKPVPLADYFLKVKFLNSNEATEKSLASGKLSTEIGKSDEISKSKVTLQYTDGVLFILLALLSLIAFVRISGKSYLNRIFTSVINFSYSNSFFKEKNLAYTLNNNLLMIVFYISTALVFSVTADYFQFTGPFRGKWEQLLFYGFFMLICVVLYKLTYRILGVFTGFYTEAAEYLFFFGNLLKILGITYVILLFGSFFTTNTGQTFFIYTAVIMTIFMFFVKFYRLLVIFLRNRFSLYYMILYFCALEIIPVILLVKVFKLIFEEELSIISALV